MADYEMVAGTVLLWEYIVCFSERCSVKLTYIAIYIGIVVVALEDNLLDCNIFRDVNGVLYTGRLFHAILLARTIRLAFGIGNGNIVV